MLNRAGYLVLALVLVLSACGGGGGGADAGDTGSPSDGPPADGPPSGDGPPPGDTGGKAVELTVESFNVGLAGAFIPAEAERRKAVLDAIAKSTADVVCIQEAWEEADKQAIIAAAKAVLPNAVTFQNDLATPVEELEQPGCTVLPLPTTPPCAGDLEAPMNAALDCLRDNCSTKPGSDEGQTTSTDCAQAECLTEAGALLFGDAAAQRCYGCIAPNLPSETFATIRDQCVNEVGGDLAFRGQNGLIILSRYPLSNANALVLPATWNRRIIASATVTLPNQATVDVYCNHVSAVFNNLAFPYTGRYGCGETGAEGWEAEQKLQLERLVSYVDETSGANAAVILGDFNTGRAYPDDGVEAEAPANYDVLTASFVEPVPADYTPACTYCPDNALNGPETLPVWIDHIFVKNIDPASVLLLERTYTGTPVMAKGPDGPVSLPLSDHYGLRAVIAIAAP